MKSQYKILRFSFTTGITHLALSDFFSGANTVVDLTMDPEYAGIVGFNDTELRQYFGGKIKDVAKTRGKDTTEVLNEMKKWHDGFQFTIKNESLYSPVSVIGYLRSEGDLQAWSNTSGPSNFLVQSLKEFPREALEIFVNYGINDQSDKSKEVQIEATLKELTGKINFEDSTDVTALTVLLFHNGYLRIKSYNATSKSFILKFTNLEMKEDYAERLYYSFTGKGVSSMKDRLDSMAKDLDKYHWDSFIQKLNSHFSDIPF